MKDLLSEADAAAVITILLDQLDVTQEQLVAEARFIEDLGADSLTMVEMNMALEDRFELSIPDQRAEKVQTVRDLFELVAEALQSHRPRLV